MDKNDQLLKRFDRKNDVLFNGSLLAVNAGHGMTKTPKNW